MSTHDPLSRLLTSSWNGGGSAGPIAVAVAGTVPVVIDRSITQGYLIRVVRRGDVRDRLYPAPLFHDLAVPDAIGLAMTPDPTPPQERVWLQRAAAAWELQ